MYELTVFVGAIQGQNFDFGKSVSPARFAEFESDIAAISGGISRQDSVGAWRNDSGEMLHEPSYRYTIVADSMDMVKDIINYVNSRGIVLAQQDSILAYYKPIETYWISAK